jgi:hypothetical protein
MFESLMPMLAIPSAIPALAVGLAATGAGMAMAAGNRVDPKLRTLGQEIDDVLARRGQILASDKTYLPEQSRLERGIMAEAVFGKGQAAMADKGALELSMEAARRLNAFDIGQARELAPQAMEIFRQNTPYMSLMQQVMSEAGSQLAAGSGLDAATERQVTQAARSRLAERGMGSDLAGAMAETTTLGQAGEQLRARRQQFALEALRTGIAGSPDLFRMITGRETGINPALAGSGAAGGQQTLQSLMSYASNLYGDNLRSRLYAQETNRQQTNQLASSIMGLGSLGLNLGMASGGLPSSG